MKRHLPVTELADARMIRILRDLAIAVREAERAGQIEVADELAQAAMSVARARWKRGAR